MGGTLNNLCNKKFHRNLLVTWWERCQKDLSWKEVNATWTARNSILPPRGTWLKETNSGMLCVSATAMAAASWGSERNTTGTQSRWTHHVLREFHGEHLHPVVAASRLKGNEDVLHTLQKSYCPESAKTSFTFKTNRMDLSKGISNFSGQQELMQKYWCLLTIQENLNINKLQVKTQCGDTEYKLYNSPFIKISSHMLQKIVKTPSNKPLE